jgi:hypothetical protein
MTDEEREFYMTYNNQTAFVINDLTAKNKQLRQSLRELLMLLDRIAVLAECKKECEPITRARKFAYPEGDQT